MTTAIERRAYDLDLRLRAAEPEIPQHRSLTDILVLAEVANGTYSVAVNGDWALACGSMLGITLANRDRSYAVRITAGHFATLLWANSTHRQIDLDADDLVLVHGTVPVRREQVDA